MVQLSYRAAVAQAIAEEMERDPTVILLGEDVGRFGGAMAATKGLYDRFGPARVIDTPLSEAAIIGTALGASMTGLRPVAEIMFIDFTTCAMDQIANQVAKARYMSGGQVATPLVIRTQGGAGKSYAAQHSQNLEVWFAAIPGLHVVMPATPADAKGLLKAAIRSDDPVMVIENKLLYGEMGDVPASADYLVPIGKAEVVRPGASATVVSYSRQLLEALKAADVCAESGIECEVINLRSISPLDIETVLRSVRKTGHAVVVEEGHRSFGVGAELCAEIAERTFGLLQAPVVRVASLDNPIPFSPVLEKATIPDAQKIVAAVRGLFPSTS